MFGFCAAKSWEFFLLAECGVRWLLGSGRFREDESWKRAMRAPSPGFRGLTPTSPGGEAVLR